MSSCLGEAAIQRVQMHDVVRGVFQLRVAERAAQPVGALLAFLERHAEHVLHEALIPHARADAGKPRGDLRVEQGRRRHAARALERDDVFRCAVHHLEHAGIGEHRRERFAHAVLQRVGQEDLRRAIGIVERDLYERQLRPVGAFADELGVQAYAGGAVRQARREVGGVGDPVVHEASCEQGRAPD